MEGWTWHQGSSLQFDGAGSHRGESDGGRIAGAGEEDRTMCADSKMFKRSFKMGLAGWNFDLVPCASGMCPIAWLRQ
jgi:hypothetical protein